MTDYIDYDDNARLTCELIRTSEADAQALYNKWLSDPNLTNIQLKFSLPNQHGSIAEWWVWAEIVDHMASLHKKYTVKTCEVEIKPGCWNCLDVSIILNDGDAEEVIGQYRRTYSSLFNTFYPFLHHGKEYALYSQEYTATRIMSLPDCNDICGEDINAYGFCPTDYFVPYDPYNDCHGDFGFVAGCVWGDDSSWKIQYLDLSRIEEGIFTRQERFGYLELPDNMSLKEAIKYDGNDHNPDYIAITNTMWFNLKTGKPEYL